MHLSFTFSAPPPLHQYGYARFNYGRIALLMGPFSIYDKNNDETAAKQSRVPSHRPAPVEGAPVDGGRAAVAYALGRLPNTRLRGR